MKKLMIAAAVAAMGVSAIADTCTPPNATVPGRVYKVQMNVFTTKGVATDDPATCTTPGGCLIRRGKDKTVWRGCLRDCGGLCDPTLSSLYLADVRRKGLFQGTGAGTDTTGLELVAGTEWCAAPGISSFAWPIGVNNTDAEVAWTLSAPVIYRNDFAWTQQFDLQGAGYGVVRSDDNGVFFDRMTGYFAGYASGSYDLNMTPAQIAVCACPPSSVVSCGAFNVYLVQPTVAFGTWKIWYDAGLTARNVSANGWDAAAAVRQLAR